MDQQLAHDIDEYCPRYEQAMSVIGKRWTGLILRALLSGACRFNGITAYVPGLSDRLLSERLKELEAEGIVERRVYPETPVRIEYTLTPKGLALRGVVEAAQTWADQWVLLPEAGS
ncbi:MAG TPA: helix-turn-helix domain-containing protein [Dehalococcoidia bacterium]|nr:helix-turn-helix domain-containing protein [Dehalococcoidia bacterium]